MTDASNEGWGAVCGPQSTGGLWASDEKRHHISYLEMLAVFLGLKAVAGQHLTGWGLPSLRRAVAGQWDAMIPPTDIPPRKAARFFDRVSFSA